MRKNKRIPVSIRQYDPHHQIQIAVILMAVIPALSLFYVGIMLSGQDEELPLYAQLITYGCTLLVAISGYRILQLYSKSIVWLRDQIRRLAIGTLPEKFILEQTAYSDDLKYIENNLNAILHETNKRLALIKEKLRIESELRTEIEKQHRKLVLAERHRVMVQSLETACRHVPAPAPHLFAHLDLMKKEARTAHEAEKTGAVIKAVKHYRTILQGLRDVNRFRTIPYVDEQASEELEILAV